MITVVNMIPLVHSGETNQDSEPNLAVNPANPQQLAGSAFTPDPLGGANAPIFVSNDGGHTWVLSLIVPSQAGRATGDISLRFSGTGSNLYTGILRIPGRLRLTILRTADPLGPGLMTVLVDRLQEDQPYVQAVTVPSGPDAGRERVYVGSNDFAAPNGRTATIDVSLDAGNAAPPPPSGFTSPRLDPRATAGQDGPPIRPAVHPDGTIYGVYYGWRSRSGSLVTADVVVVRDDNWGAGATAFRSLSDPGDNLAGTRVVTGRTVPFVNQSQPAFGQERFVGSNLSIAVDPRNSSNVYVAWADGTGSADYTLHVRRSTDRGRTWSNADLRTVTTATNPALAITSEGRLGFLYQAVRGAAGQQRWETHIERTTNDFASTADAVLATVPAGTPAPQFIPYIGDYLHLMAAGGTFYGIFSANNTPDAANFPQGVRYQRNANFTTRTLLNVSGTAPVAPSIDPFFFKVTDLISQLTLHTGWRGSWANIVPGSFGGNRFTDLVFYDPSAGTGEFYATDGQGGISLLHTHTDWRPSWDAIVVGSFGGDRFSDLLFYDAAAGTGEFYTTDGQGGMALLRTHTDWRPSWKLIIAGNFGGGAHTDLLFYDAAAGTGEFYATDGQGGIELLRTHTDWRTSWDAIIPGNFGGGARTDLLFYDAAANTGEFYATDGQGGIELLHTHTDWRSSWNAIVPGNFGGNPRTDLLFYDAAASTGEFYTTDGAGGISLLGDETSWRPTWTRILPGSFGGSARTDLLFYDAGAGHGEFYAVQ